MKKIIFSDIDRTLAKEGVISDKNTKYIKKYVSKGNLFVLVSGRTILYSKDVSIKIGASKYVICNNGAVTCDYENNKIISMEKIPFELVKKVFVIANKYESRFIIGTNNNTYVNKLLYENETLIKDITKDFYDNNIICQITVSNKDKEVIKKVIEEVHKIKGIKIINRCRSLYDDSYVANGNIWIDITNENVNKGKAVLDLLMYLNIDLEDSVRIGDDLNDLSMFFDKGLNVAVENAMPDLKSKADFITKSCDDAGVSYAIEKIMSDITGLSENEITNLKQKDK